MSNSDRSPGKREHFRIATSQAAALTLTLVAFAVLLGSQVILRQKTRGLRAQLNRRLKAPKDLLHARISNSKDPSSHDQPLLPSAEVRHDPSAGSRAIFIRSFVSIPTLAAAVLTKPKYLRQSDDPNTHSGPPV